MGNSCFYLIAIPMKQIVILRKLRMTSKENMCVTLLLQRVSDPTPKAVREWLVHVGVKTGYIEAGSPWENGYIESFNGKLQDELLNGEIFDTLFEAKVLIEQWRIEYNTIRPNSSLGYRPPAPETFESISATLQLTA